MVMGRSSWRENTYNGSNYDFALVRYRPRARWMRALAAVAK
jgi:hypothetical protein